MKRFNASIILTAVSTLILLDAATLRADITVDYLPPGIWGQPDEAIGLGGGVVEDFEDAFLAPGLQIEISDPRGAFSGVGWTVLPNLFDPVSDDPFGDVFESGVWDGDRVLVNTTGNASIYYGSPDWRPVAVYVPAGAAWIALASQQVTQNHLLYVNGSPLGNLGDFGFNVSAGRNGVLIVRSDDPAEPVVSVSFGGRGDAFVIDHVVYGLFEPVASESARWSDLKTIYAE